MDLCLCFEAHQPYRIRGDFRPPPFGRMGASRLFWSYFDEALTKSIFLRISKECYEPTFERLLMSIEESKAIGKPFKISFSLSGLFLEECLHWNEKLIERLQDLAKTGFVEFIEETYYHSLASLYPGDSLEFKEQVEDHRRIMARLLGVEPKVFANTELIYGNAIAKAVESMGYEGIFAEGVSPILKGWESPNYVYSAEGCDRLKVLLRNYRLTDDIAFRFSSKSWEGYPLTADKYAEWLNATPGDCLVLFMDIETFGEHHKKDTGIFEFLEWLPRKVAEYEGLSFKTPSEILQSHKPKRPVKVPEDRIVSWADLERDESAWIGNSMQRLCFETLKGLEAAVKGLKDDAVLRIWRCLQTSDHLYYMATKPGESGQVHSYFSPYEDPYKAFAAFLRVLTHFEAFIASRQKSKT
ncbi:MAG: glycoside hydrolase family 57 protein [Candidatus Bathyarchaeia archaeon]